MTIEAYPTTAGVTARLEPTAEHGSASKAGAVDAYSPRYDMIDAWRGLAALVVVLTHLEVTRLGLAAVMLFFVISGYCITAAAESGRSKGMTLRTFMWRRFRRVYPPYLLSLVFFIGTRVARKVLTGVDFPQLTWLQWLQNLTLTQWMSLPFGQPRGAAENPINAVTAYWSLQYEEQFYLVVGLSMLMSALGARILTALLMSLSAALLASGFRQGGATGFFLDYWLHFGIGAIVYYRLCKVTSRSARWTIDISLLLGAAALWWLNLTNGPGLPHRATHYELSIVLSFSVVLILLRPLDRFYKATWITKPLTALGMISYSLYLVHQFNMNIVRIASEKLWRGAPPTGSLVLQVVLHIGIAVVFWYLCERPFLNRPAGSVATKAT